MTECQHIHISHQKQAHRPERTLKELRTKVKGMGQWPEG